MFIIIEGNFLVIESDIFGLASQLLLIVALCGTEDFEVFLGLLHWGFFL